jgi:hypothetical protein
MSSFDFHKTAALIEASRLNKDQLLIIDRYQSQDGSVMSMICRVGRSDLYDFLVTGTFEILTNDAEALLKIRSVVRDEFMAKGIEPDDGMIREAYEKIKARCVKRFEKVASGTGSPARASSTKLSVVKEGYLMSGPEDAEQETILLNAVEMLAFKYPTTEDDKFELKPTVASIEELFTRQLPMGRYRSFLKLNKDKCRDVGGMKFEGLKPWLTDLRKWGFTPMPSLPF